MYVCVVEQSGTKARKRQRRRGTKPTGVGHKLEGSAEVAVAGRRAGAHVEDVGGERRETFDVGVPGRRLDDPVAPLVLVLRWTTLNNKTPAESESLGQEVDSPSRST